MTNGGNYGQKLQALITGGCVDPQSVGNLSSTQKEKIESLSWTEVDNLINAYQKTGQVVGFFWI